jgi:hypothetical protein
MPTISHVLHALEAEGNTSAQGSGVSSAAKEWADTTLKVYHVYTYVTHGYVLHGHI